MGQGNNGNDKYNGNGRGNGHDHHNGDGDNDHKEADETNVIRIPTLAERDKMRREQEKALRQQYRAQHSAEPMFNLPPVTKYFAGILIVIQIIASLIIDPIQNFWLMNHFGFVPAVFTGFFTGTQSGGGVASLLNLLGPFTYIFLHGGWIHLGMNVMMLLAFGSGVERWLGAKRYITFFIVCSVIAALIHLAFDPFSINPVIGASGGLSGLFAAVLVLLQQIGRMPAGKYGLLPMILLWVGISVLFGTLGGPGGSSVAWIAHIGGFLAGFIILKPIMKMKP